MVPRIELVRDVHDNQYKVATFESLAYLNHHLAPERTVGFVNPRSIDQHDLPATFSFTLGNVHDALNTVARGLRLRRNDGQLLANHSIEQRRLTGVGPAENADESGAEWHEIGFRLSASGVRAGAGSPKPEAVHISFNCWGCTAVTRTRSTFRSVDSRTSKRRPSSSTVSPLRGILPASSLTNPAMVADSFPSGLLPNSSPRRSTSMPPETMNPRSPSRTISGLSRSSRISPTISSTRSSIVTRPATPPYSSTTMAMRIFCFCISRSRSLPSLLSGTKCTSLRMIESRVRTRASLSGTCSTSWA